MQFTKQNTNWMPVEPKNKAQKAAYAECEKLHVAMMAARAKFAALKNEQWRSEGLISPDDRATLGWPHKGDFRVTVAQDKATEALWATPVNKEAAAKVAKASAKAF